MTYYNVNFNNATVLENLLAYDEEFNAALRKAEDINAQIREVTSKLFDSAHRLGDKNMSARRKQLELIGRRHLVENSDNLFKQLEIITNQLSAIYYTQLDRMDIDTEYENWFLEYELDFYDDFLMDEEFRKIEEIEEILELPEYPYDTTALDDCISRKAKRSKRLKKNHWKKQKAKRSAEILNAKWTKAQHDDNMTYEEMRRIDMRATQAQKKSKRFFKKAC